MSSHKKTIRRILYVLVSILFVSYVIFQSKNLLLGPILTINEPRDGATLASPIVNVNGLAKNVAYIYLNDRQIFVDTEGHFNEKLIAPVGHSIIKLNAQDKFGREKEMIIRVILEKDTNVSPIEELPSQTGTSTKINN